MNIPITATFLCLFIVIYIGLSALVIRTRTKNKIPLGDGNHIGLTKAISAHNNFNQYVPLGLLGILVGEIQAANPLLLFCAGLALLLGRLWHAVGIIVVRTGPNWARVLGMVFTFGALLVLAASAVLT